MKYSLYLKKFLLILILASAFGLGACGGGGDDDDPVMPVMPVMPEIPAMVWIKPGTFKMGSPDTEPNRYSNETQHSVKLTKGFYMSKYQVTQNEYTAVMGSNPSSFSSTPDGVEVQGKRPVEAVSWYDAIVFCNKLSMSEGLSPVYSINGSTNPADWGAIPTSDNATWNGVIMVSGANGYRLPTEAEWEYACRAGTTTAYNTGAALDGNAAWYSANSNSKTHEVGKKNANAWGLYDMHGNVWEWCWDRYDDFTSVSTQDPVGASSGSYRVLRGGGWGDSAGHLRSAFRSGGNPSFRFYDVGFRLVRP
ncbi:MAG: formylglycine-generating enzyme family protein [Spirochaetes bacterium]|nr:formylglycine-generating enzyme family protein [Spirochaetota bacterium]